MIDAFHRLGLKLRPLRGAAIVLSVAFVIAAAAVALLADSAAHERFLMPAIVGLLWSLSAYVFIVAFQHVPTKPADRDGWFARTGRRLRRGWYWLLALVFLGTTGVALFTTLRLATIWLRDY